MGVYSTYSLSESSNVYNNSKDNMLDLMIESAQNDMKMFDSVIELDFMHAYSEAGLVSVNEADDETAEKSIGKKIKELFEKLKTKVKNFVNTFISKIQNLMHNDSSLYKDNIDNFTKAMKSSKKITIDGYAPIADPQKILSGLKNGLEHTVLGTINTLNSQIDSASSESDIDKVLDQLSEDKAFKNVKKTLNDVNSVFFTGDKKDDYEVKPADFANIGGVMASGGKRMVNMVRDIGKDVDKAIEDEKRKCKYEKYLAGYLDDKDADLTVAKANAKYKICNKFASFITKFTSSYCNATSRYVAAARKAFLAISRKGASLEESAYDADFDAYILGEASDIYVERALSMAG